MPDQGGVDRLPPQSREAERSVLGSMLRDNGVIGDVLQILREDNFYTDAHQKIFKAVITLHDRGHPVDLVMLAELGVTGQTYTLAQALSDAYDRIDTRQQGDLTTISGLPTGFIDLDEKTAGLQNSELIILAARPSCGKTALCLNLARHVAVEE